MFNKIYFFLSQPLLEIVVKCSVHGALVLFDA